MSDLVDAVVVGAGIIGSTVTNALSKSGRRVLLLDDRRANAGTPPSGGHLRPNWFRGMSKDQYEPAMQLLDQCWGLKDEEFSLRTPGLGITVTSVRVFRVNTDQVLKYPYTKGRVTSLFMLDNYPVVTYVDSLNIVVQVRCRLLVVATGAWVGELFNDVEVKGKVGVSFRLRGNLDGGKGIIQPWAPYKQVVLHQHSLGEVWAGDGSALKSESWKESRTQQCLERCRGVLGHPTQVLTQQSGIRPYVALPDGEPCLLRRLGLRAWLATGAGKLGTIAAGWVAWRILQAVS